MTTYARNLAVPIHTKLGAEYAHPDYLAMAGSWELVRDNLLSRVKSRRMHYLPHPTPEFLKSPDNALRALAERRYTAYLRRAVYVPMTRRTRSGLIGQVNQRPPLITVPEAMNYLLNRASLDGQPLNALATMTVGELASMGRGGLFVDYSQNTSRTYINFIATEDIITWAAYDGVTTDEASRLRMVMFRQAYDDLSEDSTTVTLKVRLVHMAIRGGVASARVRTVDSDWTAWVPLLAQGTPLVELPFFMLGAEGNDTIVDVPPMLELAAINISHYCNTADYEEMVHMAGQATPVFTGLTESWYKDILNNTIRFGSYGGIPLPSGADAKYLQIMTNTVAAEAIKQKESMARAVGAQLIEERQIRRTAAEVGIEAAANHSTLSLAAANTEEGLTAALRMAAKFVGADEAAVFFKFNADYSGASSTPDARRVIVDEWMKGAITFGEMRDSLRQANPNVGSDDEAAAKEIEDEKEARALAQAKLAEYTNSATQTPQQQGNTPNVETSN